MASSGSYPIILNDQCSDFFRFLASCQKSNPLNILQSDQNLRVAEKIQKAVIIIDDYPLMLNRRIEEFRSVLFDIKRRKTAVPLIFICNLDEGVTAMSNNMLIFSQLFSDELLDKLNFLKVNMNPITKANIVKCLKLDFSIVY